MGVINTCEKEMLYKLLDGNYLLIEKQCTLDDSEGGYDISLLKSGDAKDHGEIANAKDLPVAYDGAVTLSLYEWAAEYAEIVDHLSDDIFADFDFGSESDKVEKLLEALIKKVRELQPKSSESEGGVFDEEEGSG